MSGWHGAAIGSKSLFLCPKSRVLRERARARKRYGALNFWFSIATEVHYRFRKETSMDQPSTFIHPSAAVEARASIGTGVKIWHFCHVMRGAVVGASTILGQNVFIGADVVEGSGCKIQNDISLYTSVELADEVFCGPSCVFTNVSFPRAFIERKQEFKRTLVQRGASIGANATIVCGDTIGAFALIGAGAVVAEDVPAYGLVVGVPGKVVGYVCECGHRLVADASASYSCRECPKQYEMVAGKVRLKAYQESAVLHSHHMY